MSKKANLGNSSAAAILNSKTTEEKSAIARHATQLFTAMPGKLPLTNMNAKGNRELAERAIELAEYFHDVLTEKGYDGGSR